MGGCGSLSGRWLHGPEHGAARPETDVEGHRAQASQPCHYQRPLPAGPELLADRHADRGLLPPPRRPLYRHERRDRHPAGEQRHRALQEYPKRDVQQGYFQEGTFLLPAESAEGGVYRVPCPLRVSERPGGQKPSAGGRGNGPHRPANLPVGAGGPRPQLHPAQAGGTADTLPHMVEPAAGPAEHPHQMGEERPGERKVYLGLLGNQRPADESRLCRGHRVPKEGLPLQAGRYPGEEAAGLDRGGAAARADH